MLLPISTAQVFILFGEWNHGGSMCHYWGYGVHLGKVRDPLQGKPDLGGVCLVNANVWKQLRLCIRVKSNRNNRIV